MESRYEALDYSRDNVVADHPLQVFKVSRKDKDDIRFCDLSCPIYAHIREIFLSSKHSALSGNVDLLALQQPKVVDNFYVSCIRSVNERPPLSGFAPEFVKYFHQN